MKQILVALLMVYPLFGYCQKVSEFQSPLLKNGNMEQNPAQSWVFNLDKVRPTNINGCTWGHSLEAAVSGEYSLKINCEAVRNDTAHCYVYQSFSSAGIPVGAKLTLKAKIKTVNVQGKGASITLRGDKTVNGQGKSIFFVSSDTKTPIKGTNEFEEYSVTLDSYPGNADYLAVLIVYLPGTTGAVYLDDVAVVVN